MYVAYKTTRNFVDVVFKKSKLKLYINMKTGTLDDPRGLARDVESPVHIGHWGNGDYEVEVTASTDLDYVMDPYPAELRHQSVVGSQGAFRKKPQRLEQIVNKVYTANMKMSDRRKDLRPREKLQARGAEALSDYEL